MRISSLGTVLALCIGLTFAVLEAPKEKELLSLLERVLKARAMASADSINEVRITLTDVDKQDIQREDVTATDLESKLEEHDQLIEAVFNPDESSSSSSEESDGSIVAAPVSEVRKRRSFQTVYIVATGLTAGYKAWILSQEMSGGCLSFPSICESRQQIGIYIHLTEIKTEEFNELYTEGLIQYNDLRDSVYNEMFMANALNEGMDSLDAIQAKVSALVSALLTDVNQLIEMAPHMDEQEFTRRLLSSFEDALKTLEGMVVLPSVQGQMGQALAMKDTLAEVLGTYINNLIQSMDNADFSLHDNHFYYVIDPEQELSDKDITQLQTTHDEALLNGAGEWIKGGFDSTATFYNGDVPFVSRTFQNIESRPFLYMAGSFSTDNTPQDKVFFGRRTIDNTIYAILTDFDGVLSHLETIQESLDGRWSEFSNADYRLTWEEEFNRAVYVHYKALESQMTVQDWAAIAVTLHNISKVYEAYYGQLVAEYNALQMQIDDMDQVYDEVIINFRSMCGVAQNMIDRAMDGEQLQMMQALVPSFTMLHNTYFQTLSESFLNKTTLTSEQTMAIPHFNSLTDGFNVIQAHMHVRMEFYTTTTEQVTKDKHVSEIYALLKTVFEQSLASEARAFGESLTETDVLCAIAAIYGSRAEYDSYNLDNVRLICNTGEGSMADEQAEAQTERYQGMMEGWVQVDVEAGGVSVETTLDTVKRLFVQLNEPGMQEFADAQTEKEILCIVPAFTDASNYDMYEMKPFSSAPDCDHIDAAWWAQIQNDRNARYNLEQSAANEWDQCKRNNFCECWETLLARYQVSNEELKEALRETGDGENEWCGGSAYFVCPTPNCVNLRPPGMP